MIVIANKCDVIDMKKMKYLKERIPNIIPTSAIEGKGIYELRERILSEFFS